MGDNIGSDASNEVEHRHQRHPGCPVCECEYLGLSAGSEVHKQLSASLATSLRCAPMWPQCGSMWPQCGSYMGPKLLTSDSYRTQILGPQRMTSCLSSGGCQSLR